MEASILLTTGRVRRYRGRAACTRVTGKTETAASMVVDLVAAREDSVAWCGMTPPCTSTFLPVPVGPLSAKLMVAGREHDPRSFWWLMHELADAVHIDYATFAPMGRNDLGVRTTLSSACRNPTKGWLLARGTIQATGFDEMAKEVWRWAGSVGSVLRSHRAVSWTRAGRGQAPIDASDSCRKRWAHPQTDGDRGGPIAFLGLVRVVGCGWGAKHVAPV